ncbi:MAG: hypothetical protein K2X37_11910 [Chitinophagaceae bacterium]|nr:hypothetical protein [Chitinophagaceae bacterium]
MNSKRKDVADYEAIKADMKQIIEAAQKVIAECEKEKPNRQTVKNLAIVKINKLHMKVFKSYCGAKSLPNQIVEHL